MVGELEGGSAGPAHGLVRHAGVGHAVGHDDEVAPGAGEPAVPLQLHLRNRDGARHEALPGEDAGGAPEPVAAIGGQVLDVVERGDGGDPVAHGRRGAHDVRGRQVGVHQLRTVGAQLRRGARYGPRVEAGQTELDDRDAVAAQRAHPGGVGRGGERDDDDLHAGVGRGAARSTRPTSGACGCRVGTRCAIFTRRSRAVDGCGR
ncbi:hypothetical protein BJF90_37890 [Pseudonocardia sp. CNS-004]|nr:hypothetical protein BJF90_37890 [Pseudonocardia sp. CNS-004]